MEWIKMKKILTKQIEELHRKLENAKCSYQRARAREERLEQKVKGQNEIVRIYDAWLSYFLTQEEELTIPKADIDKVFDRYKVEVRADGDKYIIKRVDKASD